MTERSAAPKLGPHFLREPLVHFFIVGALLFGLVRAFGEDSRKIAVTPVLKADLQRRFQDEHGRPPNPTEAAEALALWKRDEALYREALERNLHLHDTSIRGVLIGKIRAEAMLTLTPPVPSDAELEAWVGAHDALYALPTRYDFQYLTFAKSEPQAEEQLNQALVALGTGKKPSELGRLLRGGNPTEEDLPKRVPPALATKVPHLTPGQWQRVDSDLELWLVRLRGTSGGRPKLEAVRARALADWTAARQEEGLRQELKKTVDLYSFEEVE